MQQIEGKAALLLHPGDRLGDQEGTVIAKEYLNDDPNGEQGKQQRNHQFNQAHPGLMPSRGGIHSSVLTISERWTGSPA
ncbi:hypothetical protein D3C84_1170270 [compost metagenome]